LTVFKDLIFYSVETFYSVDQKCTVHLRTNWWPVATFRCHLYFSSSTFKEWKAQDCGISKAANDNFMLPSKINQMKVSQETWSLPWCLPTLECILQRLHLSVSDAATTWTPYEYFWHFRHQF